MFLKANSANDPLRQSFVPMGDSNLNIYSNGLGLNEPSNPLSKKLLSRYHDESYIVPQFEQIEIKRDIILSNFRKLTKKLYVINPQSPLLAFWNILIQIAILFHFCEIPIAIFFTQAAFQTQFSTSTGVGLNVFSITIIFINIIIVRPITGFYRKGILITTAKFTISRYARFQMILNMFAWLALLIYASAGIYQLVYLKIVFYLMAYSLYKTDDQIQLKLQLKRLTLAFYRLIKLICILLFIVLWISCVYFAIDYHYYLLQEQYYPVNLWLTNSVCSQYANGNFIDLGAMYPWYVWLNYAFYWTLQSITGVGYGDLTPRNPQEVIFCNFVILFMSIVYGFFINSIWQIIAQINETGDSKAHHTKMIKRYRKKYSLHPNLTNRLGSYIYQIWSHGKNEETENTINKSLSEQLRAQLLLIRQKQFFSKIPFFKHNFNEFPQIFKELANNLRESKYGEGEIIFKQGNFHSKMCSVLTGEVKICYKNSNLVIKVQKDCVFGVADFLANIPSSYSVSARTFCKISYLDYQKFIEEIKNSPIFYVNFFTQYKKFSDKTLKTFKQIINIKYQEKIVGFVLILPTQLIFVYNISNGCSK